jgi:cysteine desulfurase family protein (TIGR01976 family)
LPLGVPQKAADFYGAILPGRLCRVNSPTLALTILTRKTKKRNAELPYLPIYRFLVMMSQMSTTSRQPQIEVASVTEIRQQFPALERVHNGYPVAYFDGPGGTQVPRYVVEKMSDYLYHHNANTHWAYPTSAETDTALEHARNVFAEFLNASPTEIAFGANMTTLTFHLSRALGLNYEANDEIVVTELDHHANVDPWSRLAVERGVTIRTVRMDTATGQLNQDDLERYIGPRTKLVAIGAASNALGTINDLKTIIRLAHDAGALAFVDAVHSAPHELIDVQELDCDFVGMSAYKFYGPHIGVLYAKRELFEQIDFPKLVPAADYAPENAETGTMNHEGMVGAGAAVEFIASLGKHTNLRENLRHVFEETHARNAQLFNRLWTALSAIPRVTLYGPPPDAARTPTLSFTIEGCTPTDAASHLAGKGLFLSHGDFYAYTVVQRFGLGEEGLIRAGCACYTTEEEIDRLIEGVTELAT